MNNKIKQVERKLRQCKTQYVKPEQDWPQDIKNAVKFLEQHAFENSCSVRRMKERCEITQYTFTSRFTYYLGTPPSQFITACRIKAAKMLLSDPDLQQVTVSEISFVIGYHSVSSFSTTFTYSVGIPPSIWRDRNLKN
ncbi:MAG TPA: AraC family transcriptional regulator [Bacteroidales bacterium]|nr:AraC family transcriptional regulator [Bacteroidales bacterium]